ncbi:MAG: CinA family nicotinamide mononucleotide deamidase-related protein [Tannerella sp.]|jgi:nicotinamide-nucleotide amidase|nr:CinA family nicotinamide mononucleotide deamidase-related protein [Tannerella sp.]
MDVEIITVGDELLIGQVVDTNSAWMGRVLNDNGFRVVRKTAVGDEETAIVAAVDEAKKRAPVVMMTGGLGPTKDDITLHALCRYFGCGMYFSEEVYAGIEQLFGRSGRPVNELTRTQAMVPDAATVIRNRAGTAPCTWFERDDILLISMPGVPSEMKWLMTDEVLPRLRRHFRQDLFIRHQSYRVSGYTESALAIHLAGFEDGLPASVKLAYLPQPGIIRLRLSAYCRQEGEAEEVLAPLCRLLEGRLRGHIISEGDKDIEAIVGERLRSRGATVATAESCTGGAIAALLTSVAGSSDYFRGGIVAYANAVKQGVLGVSADALERHGAVSREVVEQMAGGALKVTGSDFAVAVSGIAGPGGGTAEKPVGTVWIAVAGRDGRLKSGLYRFGSIREQNIGRAVNMALLLLLEML